MLEEAGAPVIVVASETDKAKTNLANIPVVEIEPLELTDPESIEVFSGKFLSSGKPLHLLFNNAGIM